MDQNLLEVMYPPRFARAVVSLALAGSDQEVVDLTALHRAAADDDADTGVYQAAADDSDEEDGEKERGLALVKQLSRAEKTTFRDGATLSRKRLLQTLVSSTGAQVLVPRLEPSYEFAGHMHQTTEVPWRHEQVMAIEEMPRLSPTVAACIEVLKNRVLSGGIKFLRGNIELVPSADFAEFTTARLQPFAGQCIVALLQIGIVPIVYELDPVTGQRWPYVPELGTYSIRVQRVRGASRYRFFWLDEQAFRYSWLRQVVRVPDRYGTVEWVARSSMGPCAADINAAGGGGIEDPTVEILHNLGSDLAYDGSITSKCASLLRLVRSSAISERNRAIADTLASLPPVATEYNHSAEAAQTRNLANGYYVGSMMPADHTQLAGEVLTANSINDHNYTRSVGAQQALAARLRHIEDATGRNVSAEFGIPREIYSSDAGGTTVVQPSACVLDGTPAPYANQYHISASRQLVQLPQARIAGDYVALADQRDTQICRVFGVPKTLIDGDSVRATSEVTSQRFNEEVESLRGTVGHILTHVYNTMSLAEDTERLVGAVEKRKRETLERDGTFQHALLSEDEFFVAEAIRRVKVTFTKPRTETSEQLKELYGFGAIDQEALCKELLRNAGFDTEQSCAIKKKLPDDARMFMVPELAAYVQHKAQLEQAEQQNELANKQLKAQEKQQKAAAAAGGGAAGEKTGGGEGSGGGGGESGGGMPAMDKPKEGSVRQIAVKEYTRTVQVKDTKEASTAEKSKRKEAPASETPKGKKR